MKKAIFWTIGTVFSLIVVFIAIQMLASNGSK